MVNQRSFYSFSFGDHREQFWHGQACSFFDVVHSAFPLPTTALPALQVAPKDGVRMAVMACNMPHMTCNMPQTLSLKTVRKI